MTSRRSEDSGGADAGAPASVRPDIASMDAEVRGLALDLLAAGAGGTAARLPRAQLALMLRDAGTALASGRIADAELVERLHRLHGEIVSLISSAAGPARRTRDAAAADELLSAVRDDAAHLAPERCRTFLRRAAELLAAGDLDPVTARRIGKLHGEVADRMALGAVGPRAAAPRDE